MKMFAFSTYDSKVGAFSEPFFAPSVEFAIREFRRAVNSEGTQVSKYPEDYTLFVVGEFDQETGKFVPQEPTSLGVAITFLEESVS